MMSSYHTYILECADESFYTGYSSDLSKRLIQHNTGCGGRYTRARTPVKLVYSEEYNTRKEAMQREIEIKKYSRVKKKALIECI